MTPYPPEGPYPEGSEVTLTAEPASGHAFDHWSGHASGTDAEVTITMDSDKTVTAHFTSEGMAEDHGMAAWVYILIGVLGGGVVIILSGLWLMRQRRAASRRLSATRRRSAFR